MPSGPSRFQTTLWSQVLLAAQEPDSAAGRSALCRLCQTYWQPVYAFVRRSGFAPADAEDLTQGFFSHILSSGLIDRADPARGRFRSFLLGALRHYLANARERESALRRGGGQERITLDADAAESWLAAEATATNDAVKCYEKAWALTLLNRALALLAEEQQAAGRAEVFTRLQTFLQRSAEAGEYDAIAADLRVSKGAVAAAVHRLTERLGELVRQSVRETLVDTSMADEELRVLYATLQQR